MKKMQANGTPSKIADKIKLISFLIRRFLTVSVIFAATALSAQAQTTAFTYQRRLTDGSLPANGIYNMQFSLFDAETGGAQISAPQTVLATVTGGIFTVK